jgi:uncharacterized protein with NAD-binding domain and iron-sulfur cluster
LRTACRSKAYKVTLFEAASELGGLVSPWKMNDVEWESFTCYSFVGFKNKEYLKDIELDDKIEL